jgi:hypothetical protein
MISVPQLANALYGTWLTLKFDIRGWECFETTLRGFWASYTAALVLAPFHLVHVVADFDPERTTLTFAPYLIVEVLSYVLSWTIFPFAMLYASEFLGQASRYFKHIVPYNWIRLPIEGPLYIILLLSDFGIVALEGVAFVNLLGLAALIIYGTFVAGVGLKIATGTAVGLVVLDFVLSLTTTLLIDRI